MHATANAHVESHGNSHAVAPNSFLLREAPCLDYSILKDAAISMFEV